MAVLQRLRQVREEQALSRRALAAKASVTQATIVRAEGGGDVRPSAHRRLADAFGVQPRELIDTRA